MSQSSVNSKGITRALFVVLGFLFAFSVLGQQTRFSKVYKPSTVVRGILESDGFYYGVTQIFSDSIGKKMAHLLEKY